MESEEKVREWIWAFKGKLKGCSRNSGVPWIYFFMKIISCTLFIKSKLITNLSTYNYFSQVIFRKALLFWCLGATISFIWNYPHKMLPNLDASRDWPCLPSFYVRSSKMLWFVYETSIRPYYFLKKALRTR